MKNNDETVQGPVQGIDWNTMSSLGLIERINNEILHPVGLAMTRNVENGHSEQVLVAFDGFWEYAESVKSTILDPEELKRRIEEIRTTP